jgi:putative ABC transport system permease protein
MSEVMQDVRFAVRALRRAPGYAIAVLWTLALGIGCNTTIFSVVNGVLLTPLDFPDEARLVSVQAMEAGGALEPLAPADVLDLERASPGLVQVAAYVPATIDHAAAGREPERLAGVRVTATFFSALGARAVHGRLFRPKPMLAVGNTASFFPSVSGATGSEPIPPSSARASD